jgi:pimeloyl-ACP methyl ester carboxylesterase
MDEGAGRAVAVLNSSFTRSHRGGSGEPLVCVHGFTDTWRTWELVLPRLERHHDVLAPTLAGHAGGPALGERVSHDLLADEVERAMDEAGFDTAHLVGNSLGGFVALQLAARGRARTVVALAPAGGWPDGDSSLYERLDYFVSMQELVKAAAPHADTILDTPEGRRRATQDTTTNFEHIPKELLVHQLLGVANCPGALELIEFARHHGYRLEAEKIDCPVRLVWGAADRLLSLPGAAVRYREQWLPWAEWIELDGIGHCPQLDVPLETAELILGFTASA